MSDTRMQPELRICADKAALYTAAVAAFAALARQAIAERGRFTVALSGGSTPQPLYEALAALPAAQAPDWTKVEVFFGDERCVPPADERSNYRMARLAMLDKLPALHVHRMRGEDEPHAAATHYEAELRRVFGDTLPRFDVILLGVGDNGHTASLFPGTAALYVTDQRVRAQYVEVQHEWRLTFTWPLINAARAVWVLVAGSGKAGVVKDLLRGPLQPEVWPAQRIAPQDGAYQWWLDAAAASQLSTKGVG
ncbi:MAG TPA: 6-phosphogluconolactonase [Nevskiaceae bacterium]|nr:6-phosphogluconolactonase [Nevskiaceae bacterium]